jgi:hypothetical protein
LHDGTHVRKPGKRTPAPERQPTGDDLAQGEVVG